MKADTITFKVKIDMTWGDILKAKILGVKKPGKIKWQPNPWGFFEHDFKETSE